MPERALEYALENHPNAEITVLHVVGEPSPMLGAAAALALEDDLEETAQERAATVFDRARDLAAEHGTEVDTEVKLGNPVKGILNSAEDFDTVVLGSHGGTLVDRLFVGDVARKVFHQSPVPVTAVR